MTDCVEKSTSRRSAALGVVGLRPVNGSLPIVVVFHGGEAIIDTREFTRSIDFLDWLNPRVRWCFGIEDPASGFSVQFVALVDGSDRSICRGEEEEDIVISDGEVEYSLPVIGFVAIDRVALECLD